MDQEVTVRAEAGLFSSLPDCGRICPDGMMGNAALLLCRRGGATVLVNYKPSAMSEGAVLVLFPGDLVAVEGASADFAFDALTFSPSILREASLDMEQTVYSSLREDRCRGGETIVTEIVSNIFSLLGAYFRQPGCTCINRLVTCQMKAFFIGFHDYLIRFPGEAPPLEGSKRKRALFDSFMRTLEQDYRKSRDVSWYAEALNITPKYLNTISQMVARHNAKAIIDHYVILKLKIELSGSDSPVKQIAWDYSFNDTSFFTRYFKLHTGVTPVAYRKSLGRAG